MIVICSFKQSVECDRVLSNEKKRMNKWKDEKRDSHHESMKVVQAGIATTIFNGEMKTPSSNERSQC